MKHYDIFISYRRSSYDTANLIATRLRSAGYSVFFDMETLRSGKFNEQLYEVIDNCKDFVIVLPPNALDRCVNEDDWVRLETCRAMEHNKNIVPIMLNGFVWPQEMPRGMEELCNYQAITASSIEYFDMSMERLQSRYLKSKRQLPIVKIMKIAGVSVLWLVAVLLIMWITLGILSKDVCVKYATLIANDAENVHMIAEQNHSLVKDWEEFDKALNIDTKAAHIAQMQEYMEKKINMVESNIVRSWNVDTAKIDIPPYHSFLLSINDINAEEVALSPMLATLYYDEYLDLLNVVRKAVRDPITLNRRYTSVSFDVLNHSYNSFYAAILSELSAFPKECITIYEQLSPNWIYFNNTYKIGEDEEYYEKIIISEGKLAEASLARYESVLEQQDATIEDLMRESENLENMIENSGMGVNDAASSAQAELEKIQRENEAELALRTEKVEAKRLQVEASKAELAELDKEYIKVYENLKTKCTIEAEDDQFYKWGKITRWGAYLAMLVESRQKLQAQGVYSTSSITPEVAYADMNSMLSVYQTYHPESKSYVPSAKQFFRELSKGTREYSGVIIFAFKDNLAHPFFQEGDIIVGYNGKRVKTYDDFKKAYKTNDSATVKFIRLTNGAFEEFEKPIADTDIIGFLNLTE